VNTLRRFLTGIVLSAVVFAGCNKAPKENNEGAEKAQEKSEEKAPEVVKLTEDQVRSAKIETVKASLKPLRVEIEALGEVASDTDRLTQVRPDSNGSIREIKVAVGDAVEAGQVLLRYAGENGSDIKELKAERPGVVVGLYAEPEGHIDPAVPLVTIAGIQTHALIH
jgi:multidrug efflux pump subunit AcrA (membrane-fusion protein)